jgi:hypothetical protein
MSDEEWSFFEKKIPLKILATIKSEVKKFSGQQNEKKDDKNINSVEKTPGKHVLT